MAEIQKSKIVIASVLKPVDDTRMTEKIGMSLNGTNQYEIHIIGFPSSKNNNTALYFHPLPRFNRLSMRRLIIPWMILKMILKIKPQLFIVTTHELLTIASLTKLILRCKVVYDIQENYRYNLWYTPAFPFLIRHILAFYVRFKETILAPFINHFFLAEKSYAHELRFPRGRYTILENKVREMPLSLNIRRNRNHLIFTGTLAETTGVFTAVTLASKLHEVNKDIRLTIAGHCAKDSDWQRLQKIINESPIISMVGGNRLVPHKEIMLLIQSAGAGIVAYPDNPSTFHSVPTKLFEYLGAQLPILLRKHSAWEKLCESYPAAVVFDPFDIHSDSILHQLRTTSFYQTTPTNVFWGSEEPKLIAAIQALLF